LVSPVGHASCEIERNGLTVEVGARDDIAADDIADRGEELEDLGALGIEGKTTDEDGTAVGVVLVEEILVGIGARHGAPLLHIEGVDAVAVVLADSLWEKSVRKGRDLM
jgi:hypothetical protein